MTHLPYDRSVQEAVPILLHLLSPPAPRSAHTSALFNPLSPHLQKES